ncbi:4'-phosphopantetheinyl transferase [Guyanagaster necrorhizus]|uniref:4'-phosphopantetheinyl transferase n=1 Tax=Guyanagaster necrorhizus TaxID=856835 RepID=A0A9P7VXD8_9AGAR|nr:4'-phosphopantetheinyl transferase [Guyanagaster necrorhizus MCA 3950]KAG7449296.1 4'-phosphopantetheinyl transferase [Guyanagaster necrorhizus MCA 3950]
MILGIGVDVVHLPRIAALIARRGQERFAQKILSNEELQSWRAIHERDRARFLAVRWAVKEAAYKAMYPTVKPTWKDLSFWSLGQEFNGSKPSLSYRSPYPDTSVGEIHSSISHDGEYVFASVLVCQRTE